MTSRKGKLKYKNITYKWGGKRLQYEFSERIDNWLQRFPEKEHQLMLNLLEYFYYYSEERIKEKSVELYQIYCSHFPERVDTAVYCQIQKRYGVGFSDFLFLAFWSNNSLYDQTEYNIIGLLESDEVPNNIVIIDDYFGTGDTFKKFILELIFTNSKIRESQITFLTIHCTNKGIKNIEDFCIEEGLNIGIISLDKSEEAFKVDYIYDRLTVEIAKRQYFELCSSQGIKSDFIYGYENIQSLVAFYYNTPNNTLGAFWHATEEFVSLFNRYKKHHTDLKSMQLQAKQKAITQSFPVITFGLEGVDYTLFMVYCIAWNGKITYEKACSDFGYTPEQLTNAIKYIVSQGYFYYEEGALRPTASLKSHLFYSRIKDFKKLYYQLQETKRIPLNEVNYIPRNFSKQFNGYRK